MTKFNSTSCDAIHSSLSDKILTLRIQRGSKKNALTRAMYTALRESLELASQHKDVRVVVIAGHDDYFTAGNDISDFLNNPPKDENSPVLRFLKELSCFPKPLVAAANGVAVGIGTTFLLHCDYVVLGPTAVLKLPFVELGLCPEAASSLLLPRSIGYLRASEMILTGAAINAETAVNWGLANKTSDNCLEAALDTARKLAKQPPTSLVLSKQLLKMETEPTVTERLKTEGVEFVKRLQSPEAIEAFTAFMQKRPANFEQF